MNVVLRYGCVVEASLPGREDRRSTRRTDSTVSATNSSSPNDDRCTPGCWSPCRLHRHDTSPARCQVSDRTSVALFWYLVITHVCPNIYVFLYSCELWFLGNITCIVGYMTIGRNPGTLSLRYFVKLNKKSHHTCAYVGIYSPVGILVMGRCRFLESLSVFVFFRFLHKYVCSIFGIGFLQISRYRYRFFFGLLHNMFTTEYT